MLRSSIAFALAGLLLAACSSNAPNGGGGRDGGLTSPDAGDGGTVASDAGSDDATVDAGTGQVLVIEPDQGMQPIYDFVSSAKKTIDLTLYEETDTTFTSLLTSAAASGIAVRIILDQNLEMSDNTPAYGTLGDAGVQAHWANPIYASTHQKTITVDGTASAIMTLNIAAEDYKTSRDFAVITHDAADVAAIETVFEADFKNAAITPPTGDDLVWSPTNAQGSLTGIIGGAKTSLLVENEEMGDYTIVNALTAAAGRGVAVDVIMENSSTYESEFLELQAAGVKVVTYGQHAPLYIHAKVILADYPSSGAKVFIGSENFSNASLTENRELGLITSDPGIMAGIHTTLTSDFSGATTYVPRDAGTTGADAAADGATPDAATPDASPSDGAADDGGTPDDAATSD